VNPKRSVTLHWSGKEPAASDPPRPPGPAPRRLKAAAAPFGKALVAKEGEVYAGDNLAVLRGLAATHAGAVTLAYLDPPFLTNRVHEHVTRGERTRTAAFDDRWSDRAAYLDALGARLSLVRELLAPHGCVVVHVDPRTSHYVKVLADEIFGEDAFASEIVWRYRRWPSKTENFQRVHDVLLRYRKDPKAKPRWTTLYEPLAASTVRTWGTTKQRAVFGEDGRRARSSSTPEPTAGTPMGDVWDIGVIAPVSRERTGYPSQKPERLLERLVHALTVEDDLVLDPFAGSGTTLAVAARMGRRFVGIDASAVALEILVARLEKQGIAFTELAPRPLPARPLAAALGGRASRVASAGRAAETA
jgi:hypothetical protein